MIWRGSRKIGIGEGGRATGKFYLVASFFPPGNIPEYFTENVLNRTKIPLSCILKICKLAQPGTGPKDHSNAKQEASLLTNLLGGNANFFSNSSEPCVLPNATLSRRCEYRDEAIEGSLLQRQKEKTRDGTGRGTKAVRELFVQALGRIVNSTKYFGRENKEVDKLIESRGTEVHADITKNKLKLSSEQSQSSNVQRPSFKNPNTLSVSIMAENTHIAGTQAGIEEEIELTPSTAGDDTSKVMVVSVPEPITTQDSPSVPENPKVAVP
ncbi:uncharacterized protein LOC114536337 isoform X2 [Dendronephthya gigantea]|uniref:uncharacterized protein LOC114536337 isoform X2 n=1 Tax=Dendronephthya gigantea TaxID=151771 RepID=UPI00106A8ED6|nr:uncharacterized protein LOC114536337 isoform X2 [Dendronephthya gigantea]XP_028413500.1 uncharacterized protein LOC114536337 isoform X2 [Dendronephthya gigantea]